jgi:hypothetical protein
MDESYNTVTTSLGTVSTDIYDYINGILANPSIIIIIVIVLVTYVSIFFSLGDSNGSSSSSSGSSFDLFSSSGSSSSGSSNSFSSMLGLNSGSTSSSDSDSDSGSTIISVILISVFAILLLINGVQYFFGIDIIAKITNILTGTPEVDITIDPANVTTSTVPEITIAPQVFNIPGNDYVYPDAKALCSAYGSRLATYAEVEESYNKGGEWCNYGWSDGQMALFPTQQKTWDGLQKIEGHENDCGRPGVNGGFIQNPAVKFGVNCYGYKPRMTSEEEDLMASNPIYPKTLKDIAMEKRVKYWKDKLSSILVSPFNHMNWSRI